MILFYFFVFSFVESMLLYAYAYILSFSLNCVYCNMYTEQEFARQKQNLIFFHELFLLLLQSIGCLWKHEHIKMIQFSPLAFN